MKMMTFALRVAITVTPEIGTHGGRIQVQLPSELDQWTLGLCLLANELVDSIRVIGRASELVIRLDAHLKRGRNGTAALDKQSVAISLGRTEIEAWQHFFLRALRDGVAEVDHLDVELRMVPDDQLIDLVLKIKKSRPPLSAEEAARLLLPE
jgi:hypothetical protein